MLAQLLQNAIKDRLHELVEDLEVDQLDLAHGKILLDDIKLRPQNVVAWIDEYTSLDLVHGVVGKLSISIHWKSLLEVACSIEIDGLAVTLRIGKCGANDESVRNEQKRREIDASDYSRRCSLSKVNQQLADASDIKNTLSFSDKLKNKLSEAMFRNFELSIRDADVRLIAGLHPQSKLFSIRASIKDFSLCPKTPAVDCSNALPGSLHFEHILRLSFLSISMILDQYVSGVNSRNRITFYDCENDLSYEDNMKSSTSESSDKCIPLLHLFGFNCLFQAAEKFIEQGPTKWNLGATIKLSSICGNCSQRAVRLVLYYLNQLSTNAERPELSPVVAPRAWWAYAITRIKESVRKRLSRASWFSIAKLLIARRAYMEQYKRLIEPASTVQELTFIRNCKQDLSQLHEIEKNMTIAQVLAFRSLAELEICTIHQMRGQSAWFFSRSDPTFELSFKDKFKCQQTLLTYLEGSNRSSVFENHNFNICVGFREILFSMRDEADSVLLNATLSSVHSKMVAGKSLLEFSFGLARMHVFDAASGSEVFSFRDNYLGTNADNFLPASSIKLESDQSWTSAYGCAASCNYSTESSFYSVDLVLRPFCLWCETKLLSKLSSFCGSIVTPSSLEEKVIDQIVMAKVFNLGMLHDAIEKRPRCRISLTIESPTFLLACSQAMPCEDVHCLENSQNFEACDALEISIPGGIGLGVSDGLVEGINAVKVCIRIDRLELDLARVILSASTILNKTKDSTPLIGPLSLTDTRYFSLCPSSPAVPVVESYVEFNRDSEFCVCASADSLKRLIFLYTKLNQALYLSNECENNTVGDKVSASSLLLSLSKDISSDLASKLLWKRNIVLPRVSIKVLDRRGDCFANLRIESVSKVSNEFTMKRTLMAEFMALRIAEVQIWNQTPQRRMLTLENLETSFGNSLFPTIGISAKTCALFISDFFCKKTEVAGFSYTQAAIPAFCEVGGFSCWLCPNSVKNLVEFGEDLFQMNNADSPSSEHVSTDPIDRSSIRARVCVKKLAFNFVTNPGKHIASLELCEMLLLLRAPWSDIFPRNAIPIALFYLNIKRLYAGGTHPDSTSPESILWNNSAWGLEKVSNMDGQDLLLVDIKRDLDENGIPWLRAFVDIRPLRISVSLPLLSAVVDYLAKVFPVPEGDSNVSLDINLDLTARINQVAVFLPRIVDIRSNFTERDALMFRFDQVFFSALCKHEEFSDFSAERNFDWEAKLNVPFLSCETWLRSRGISRQLFSLSFSIAFQIQKDEAWINFHLSQLLFACSHQQFSFVSDSLGLNCWTSSPMLVDNTLQQESSDILNTVSYSKTRFNVCLLVENLQIMVFVANEAENPYQTEFSLTSTRDVDAFLGAAKRAPVLISMVMRRLIFEHKAGKGEADISSPDIKVYVERQDYSILHTDDDDILSVRYHPKGSGEIEAKVFISEMLFFWQELSVAYLKFRSFCENLPLIHPSRARNVNVGDLSTRVDLGKGSSTSHNRTRFLISQNARFDVHLKGLGVVLTRQTDKNRLILFFRFSQSIMSIKNTICKVQSESVSMHLQIWQGLRDGTFKAGKFLMKPAAIEWILSVCPPPKPPSLNTDVFLAHFSVKEVSFDFSRLDVSVLSKCFASLPVFVDNSDFIEKKRAVSHDNFDIKKANVLVAKRRSEALGMNIHFNLTVEKLEVSFIDYETQFITPILRLGASDLSVDAHQYDLPEEGSQGRIDCLLTVYSDYWNADDGAWEPFIEPWHKRLIIDVPALSDQFGGNASDFNRTHGISSKKHNFASIFATVESSAILNITLTPTAGRQFLQLCGFFAQADEIENSAAGDSVSTELSQGESLKIFNSTGGLLRLSTFSSDSHISNKAHISDSLPRSKNSKMNLLDMSSTFWIWKKSSHDSKWSRQIAVVGSSHLRFFHSYESLRSCHQSESICLRSDAGGIFLRFDSIHSVRCKGVKNADMSSFQIATPSSIYYFVAFSIEEKNLLVSAIMMRLQLSKSCPGPGLGSSIIQNYSCVVDVCPVVSGKIRYEHCYLTLESRLLSIYPYDVLTSSKTRPVNMRRMSNISFVNEMSGKKYESLFCWDLANFCLVERALSDRVLLLTPKNAFIIKSLLPATQVSERSEHVDDPLFREIAARIQKTLKCSRFLNSSEALDSIREYIDYDFVVDLNVCVSFNADGNLSFLSKHLICSVRLSIFPINVFLTVPLEYSSERKPNPLKYVFHALRCCFFESWLLRFDLLSDNEEIVRASGTQTLDSVTKCGDLKTCVNVTFFRTQGAFGETNREMPALDVSVLTSATNFSSTQRSGIDDETLSRSFSSLPAGEESQIRLSSAHNGESSNRLSTTKLQFCTDTCLYQPIDVHRTGKVILSEAAWNSELDAPVTSPGKQPNKSMPDLKEGYLSILSLCRRLICDFTLNRQKKSMQIYSNATIVNSLDQDLSLCFKKLRVNESLDTDAAVGSYTESVNAFDFRTDTYWSSYSKSDDAGNETLRFSTPRKEERFLVLYSIASGPQVVIPNKNLPNDSPGVVAVSPSSWILEGLDSGGSWIALDRRELVNFERPLQFRSFGILESNRDIACSEYRFIFSSKLPRVDDARRDDKEESIVVGNVLLYFYDESFEEMQSFTLGPQDQTHIPFSILDIGGCVQFEDGHFVLISDLLAISRAQSWSNSRSADVKSHFFPISLNDKHSMPTLNESIGQGPFCTYSAECGKYAILDIKTKFCMKSYLNSPSSENLRSFNWEIYVKPVLTFENVLPFPVSIGAFGQEVHPLHNDLSSIEVFSTYQEGAKSQNKWLDLFHLKLLSGEVRQCLSFNPEHSFGDNHWQQNIGLKELNSSICRASLNFSLNFTSKDCSELGFSDEKIIIFGDGSILSGDTIYMKGNKGVSSSIGISAVEYMANHEPSSTKSEKLAEDDAKEAGFGKVNILNYLEVGLEKAKRIGKLFVGSKPFATPCVAIPYCQPPRHLYVFCPVVIVNWSGLALRYSDPSLALDLEHRNSNAFVSERVSSTSLCSSVAPNGMVFQPANSDEPIEENVAMDRKVVAYVTMFYAKGKKLSICLDQEDGVWSRPFGLTIGMSGNILVPSPMKENPGTSFAKDVGVSISTAKDSYFRTKVVTISPRFMVVNKCKQPVTLFLEADSEKLSPLYVEEGDSKAFYPIIAQKYSREIAETAPVFGRLQFPSIIAGVNIISTSFQLNTAKQMTLKLLPKALVELPKWVATTFKNCSSSSIVDYSDYSEVKDEFSLEGHARVDIELAENINWIVIDSYHVGEETESRDSVEFRVENLSQQLRVGLVQHGAKRRSIVVANPNTSSMEWIWEDDNLPHSVDLYFELVGLKTLSHFPRSQRSLVTVDFESIGTTKVMSYQGVDFRLTVELERTTNVLRIEDELFHLPTTKNRRGSLQVLIKESERRLLGYRGQLESCFEQLKYDTLVHSRMHCPKSVVACSNQSDNSEYWRVKSNEEAYIVFNVSTVEGICALGFEVARKKDHPSYFQLLQWIETTVDSGHWAVLFDGSDFANMPGDLNFYLVCEKRGLNRTIFYSHCRLRSRKLKLVLRGPYCIKRIFFYKSLQVPGLLKAEKERKKNSDTALSFGSNIVQPSAVGEKCHNLWVGVLEARDLSIQDLFSSDPYVVLSCGNKPDRVSQVINNSLNPIFDECFSFENVQGGGLTVEVYDKDLLSSDDFMGSSFVPLSSLEEGKVSDTWLTLFSKDGKENGQIRLCLQLAPYYPWSECNLLFSNFSERMLSIHLLPLFNDELRLLRRLRSSFLKQGGTLSANTGGFARRRRRNEKIVPNEINGKSRESATAEGSTDYSNNKYGDLLARENQPCLVVTVLRAKQIPRPGYASNKHGAWNAYCVVSYGNQTLRSDPTRAMERKHMHDFSNLSEIQIDFPSEHSMGIQIKQDLVKKCFTVQSILPDSFASRDGRIVPGMKITRVNEVQIAQGATLDDLQRLLYSGRPIISVVFVKEQTLNASSMIDSKRSRIESSLSSTWMQKLVFENSEPKGDHTQNGGHSPGVVIKTPVAHVSVYLRDSFDKSPLDGEADLLERDCMAPMLYFFGDNLKGSETLRRSRKRIGRNDVLVGTGQIMLPDPRQYFSHEDNACPRRIDCSLRGIDGLDCGSVKIDVSWMIKEPESVDHISFGVDVRLSGLGISLVDTLRSFNELAYLSVSGINGYFAEHCSKRQIFDGFVDSIQLDNQMNVARHPQIFHAAPTLLPWLLPGECSTGAGNNSGSFGQPNSVNKLSPPAMALTLIKHSFDDDSRIYVEWFSFFMQEVSIELEERWLIALQDFVECLIGRENSAENFDPMRSSPSPNLEAYATIDVESFERFLSSNPISWVDTLLDLSTTKKSAASARKSQIFIQYADIKPVRLNVTFTMTSSEDMKKRNKLKILHLLSGWPVLAGLSSALMNTVANVTDAPLRFNALKISNQRMTVSTLVTTFAGHVVGQLFRNLSQIGNILASADLLGSPVQLLGSFGKGAYSFFYEPALALSTEGYSSIGAGMGRGARELIRSTTHGVSLTLKKSMETAARAVALASLDRRFVAEEARRHNDIVHEPVNVWEGVTSGFYVLGAGVGGGLTDIALLPLRGIVSKDPRKVFAGVGKGIIGLFLKPLCGLLDASALFFSGVGNTTSVSVSAKLPRRLRRPHDDDLPMHPYSAREAFGAHVVSLFSPDEFLRYVYHDQAYILNDSETGQKGHGVLSLKSRAFLQDCGHRTYSVVFSEDYSLLNDTSFINAVEAAASLTDRSEVMGTSALLFVANKNIVAMNPLNLKVLWCAPLSIVHAKAIGSSIFIMFGDGPVLLPRMDENINFGTGLNEPISDGGHHSSASDNYRGLGWLGHHLLCRTSESARRFLHIINSAKELDWRQLRSSLIEWDNLSQYEEWCLSLADSHGASKLSSWCRSQTMHELKALDQASFDSSIPKQENFRFGGHATLANFLCNSISLGEKASPAFTSAESNSQQLTNSEFSRDEEDVSFSAVVDAGVTKYNVIGSKIRKARITGHEWIYEGNKSVCMYRVVVASAESQKGWVVWRRFSQFLELRDNLMRLMGNSRTALPLPSRLPWRISEKENAIRQRGLNSMIRMLWETSALVESPMVRNFFTYDAKDITLSFDSFIDLDDDMK